MTWKQGLSHLPCRIIAAVVAERELLRGAAKGAGEQLMPKAGGFAAVFCGSDHDGWRYIIGSLSCDLRAGAKAINALIDGRGGGKPQMIQGSAAAARSKIEDALKALSV